MFLQNQGNLKKQEEENKKEKVKKMGSMKTLQTQIQGLYSQHKTQQPQLKESASASNIMSQINSNYQKQQSQMHFNIQNSNKQMNQGGLTMNQSGLAINRNNDLQTNYLNKSNYNFESSNKYNNISNSQVMMNNSASNVQNIKNQPQTIMNNYFQQNKQTIKNQSNQDKSRKYINTEENKDYLLQMKKNYNNYQNVSKQSQQHYVNNTYYKHYLKKKGSQNVSQKEQKAELSLSRKDSMSNSQNMKKNLNKSSNHNHSANQYITNNLNININNNINLAIDAKKERNESQSSSNNRINKTQNSSSNKNLNNKNNYIQNYQASDLLKKYLQITKNYMSNKEKNAGYVQEHKTNQNIKNINKSQIQQQEPQTQKQLKSSKSQQMLNNSEQLFYYDRMRQFFRKQLNINVMQNPTTKMGCQTHQGYQEQIYKEHFLQTFHGLHYTAQLPDVKFESLRRKSYLLEQSQVQVSKKTLILDLDETLVHCSIEGCQYADYKIKVENVEGRMVDAGVKIRPYAREFIQKMSKFYEVGIFTASQKQYAEQVIKILDPLKKYIQFAVFRDNCLCTENGMHVKDLRIFINRKIENLIMVDNSAYVFGLNIDNGVPIIPFYDDPKDDELYLLENYLMKLRSADIRKTNRASFRLNEYLKYQDWKQLVKKVFLQ